MIGNRYFIGVDIGGTNTVVGIVDNDGSLIAKESFKTKPDGDHAVFAKKIYDFSVGLAVKAGIPMSDIAAVGAACPGVIKDGRVVFSANLKMNDVQFDEMLKQHFSVPSYVCNDANAAAFAEAVCGCGKGAHSLVVVTIGTGIGGGIVLDGKIYDGVGGAAAEIGHITVVPQGRQCACGRKGCFECYCSATALVNDTKEAMLDNPDSKMWQVASTISDVDGQTVFRAMKLGDKAAKKVFDRFCRYFGIGISNIITLLQPEIIVIGGGMSAEGETLVAPIRKYASQMSLKGAFEGKTEIMAAKLGNDAGVLGAALYAMEENKE